MGASTRVLALSAPDEPRLFDPNYRMVSVRFALLPPMPVASCRNRKLFFNRARAWRRIQEAGLCVVLSRIEAASRFPAYVVMLDRAPVSEAQVYFVRTYTLGEFSDMTAAECVAAVFSLQFAAFDVVTDVEVGRPGLTLWGSDWPGVLSGREKRRRWLNAIRGWRVSEGDMVWRGRLPHFREVLKNEYGF